MHMSHFRVELSRGNEKFHRAGGEYWNFSFSSLSYYRYYPELRISRKNRSALEDDDPEVRVSRKNRSALEEDDDDCAYSGEFVVFFGRQRDVLTRSLADNGNFCG